MADTEEKKTLEDTEKHSKKRIYLDYNATTPLSAEVVKAVTEALQEAWGNPSSSYSAGCMAKQLIDKARAHIASMVKGKPEDIIFTSGGTEANNMVLFSTVEQFNIRAKESSSNGVDKALPHIITSNVEHDSIVLPLQHLQRAHRAEVTFVPVSTTTGRVEIDDVIAALRPNTCLVSVMLANNETGVIMPVGELSQRLAPISKQRASQGLPAILLHTDAAQALGKIRVDVQELQVNYLTIVGHKEPETNEELNVSTPITPAHPPKKRKNLGEATTLFLTKATTAVQWKPDESDAFGIITANKLKEMSEEQRQFAESLLPEVLNQGFYGPRIGALYVRGIGHQTPLLPMLYGGGQERNYRPGTENTPMIVGLGKAAELVSLHCAVYKSHLREVRDYLEQRLQAAFGDRIRFNSHFPGTKRLPNTCNVSLLKPSVLGREWLAHCHSLQASVGAACHSDRGDSPSHVLLSSGVSRESARGAVRLSVGRETSREDIDVIVRDLEQAAQKLECKESSKRDLKT